MPLAGLLRVSEELLTAITFTPQDVMALLAKVDIVASSENHLSSIAQQLKWAMFDFLRASSADFSSPPSERRKWAFQVRDRALDLLSILDADPQTGRLRQADSTRILLFDQPTDPETHIIRQAMGPLLYAVAHQHESLTGEEMASLPDQWGASSGESRLRSRPEDFPIPDDSIALSLAIFGVACVAKIADSTTKAFGELERGKKRPNFAEANLVGELSRIYLVLSGQKAKKSPKRSTTLQAPAIAFCGAVATMALDRLPWTALQLGTDLLKIRNSLTELANNPSIVRDRIRDFEKGGHRAR